MRREVIETVRPLLRSAVGDSLEIKGFTRVGGGCINAAGRIDTTEGPFFCKWSAQPPGFDVEARSLEALRESGTRLVIPQVVVQQAPGRDRLGLLVLEWLESGQPAPHYDAALGEGLAELHRATRPTFGFDVDTFCGTTRQPNPPESSWPTFYRDHRLGFLVSLLEDRGELRGSAVETTHRFLERVPDLLGDAAPALIHGDLWSGNALAHHGAPAIIDPAVYYAHREAELGMMTLFGGFSRRTYEAYHAAWPLDAGWEERNPLYQLFHVLNHAVLFGGGYLSQALSLMRRYA